MSYIEYKQQMAANDPNLCNEINRDLTLISYRLYVLNIFKIVRLFLHLMFIVYFVGQYWFVFVQIGSYGDSIQFTETHDQDGSNNKYSELFTFKNSYSFLNYDDWDFTEFEGGEQTIVSMYYALTSLSTVGFGDYYPVTDFERIGCSILLLSGVLLMSYVLSELRFMISNFMMFNGNIEFNDELEDFFILLTKFNDGN